MQRLNLRSILAQHGLTEIQEQVQDCGFAICGDRFTRGFLRSFVLSNLYHPSLCETVEGRRVNQSILYGQRGVALPWVLQSFFGPLV